jgi:hypothetical protein
MVSAGWSLENIGADFKRRHNRVLSAAWCAAQKSKHCRKRDCNKHDACRTVEFARNINTAAAIADCPKKRSPLMTTHALAHMFTVLKSDLHQTTFDTDSAACAPLADGHIRLRINSFALTSNNITYAAFGDAMKYWNFFPVTTTASEAARGCIPVWGFADVVESRADGLNLGERIYGYFPMATHAVLQPSRISASSFVDAAEHRRELHPVYNQYTRCAADPGYAVAHEAHIALLRPLFMTSFLIDDFLADNDFFGAKAVLLSSASSKTAYGTAFCLSQRRGTPSAVKVIGLTSAANVAFTRGLGCYDQVITYDEVASLPADVPTAYVDMSGSATVRSAVHHHFNDALKHSCAVGGTHWDDLTAKNTEAPKHLPGPRPTLFFAPAQIKKRATDWGPAGLNQRTGAAWTAFMQALTNPAAPWLTVVSGKGAVAVEAVYRELLSGHTQPQQGHMLSF